MPGLCDGSWISLTSRHQKIKINDSVGEINEGKGGNIYCSIINKNSTDSGIQHKLIHKPSTTRVDKKT